MMAVTYLDSFLNSCFWAIKSNNLIKLLVYHTLFSSINLFLCLYSYLVNGRVIDPSRSQNSGRFPRQLSPHPITKQELPILSVTVSLTSPSLLYLHCQYRFLTGVLAPNCSSAVGHPLRTSLLKTPVKSCHFLT